MQTLRNPPARPDWPSDDLNSSVPPEIAPPHFDEDLDAWVLSRYEDVGAAFRSSELVPAGSKDRDEVVPRDEALRLLMRAETQDALSSGQLRSWRDHLAPIAQDLAAGLPADHPVDLLTAYARPACLALAAKVSGIDLNVAEHLRAIARPVSASAADPGDPVLEAQAKAANAHLRGCFHQGPESLRDSTFVALSHTMPALLGNAWFALLQHPEEWKLLHRCPEFVDQAVEELLRYAGLTRFVRRRATEELSLGGITIARGQHVILRIIAANRDPGRFAHANEVDVVRRDAGHFTLGAGAHSCVGASLIRMAAIAITRPLVERFNIGALTEVVAWRGGSGFRSPVSLPVLLKQ